MSRVRLTIDRLVLKGFAPAQQQALAAGLRSELARIMTDPQAGQAAAGAHRTPILRLGALPLAAGSAGGRRLGEGVAAAIGRRLKP